MPSYDVPRREPQKASATSRGANRTSSAPWRQTAIRPASRRAADSSAPYSPSSRRFRSPLYLRIEGLVADAGIDGVDLYPSQDIAQTVPSILGPGEIAGVVIAAIVLFLMLGTVLGAALPLIGERPAAEQQRFRVPRILGEEQ